MAGSLPFAHVLALGLTLAALRGQDSVVVPREHERADAPGLGEVAGLNQAARQQVLVRGEELAPLRGRELTALWLRRDVQLPVPLRGGRAELAVSLSDRAAHPGVVSAVFAENRGPEPAEVFRGVVEVPAAPAPSGPNGTSWSAPGAIEIAFARPFRYRGGNLCLEIEGRPLAGQPGTPWLVDHALATVGGTTRMAGRSCDVRLQAMAVWPTLAPGSCATMFAAGPAQTTGVCLVGRERRPPLDLAVQGAANCLLHVDPFAADPCLYPRVKLDPITRIERPLPFPALPALFGAEVAIQWVQMPNSTVRAGVATTHVQVLQLANGAPSFPGATVRSGPPVEGAFPARGDVQAQQMPVLRFVVR